MLLRYPSERFPALASVSVDAPAAWRPIDVGDTALALRRDAEPGSFAPNLLVSVRRFPADYTLKDAVANLTSALSLLPGCRELSGAEGKLDGHAAVLLAATVVDESAGELVQLAAVTVVPVMEPEPGPADAIEIRVSLPVGDAAVRDEATAVITSLGIARAD